MNDVIVMINGTEEVVPQADILSPKYDCDGCFTPEEYVARIAEYGITTVTANQDGTFTYRKISPHCICEIVFVDQC